jgi:hypothetical protein
MGFSEDDRIRRKNIEFNQVLIDNEIMTFDRETKVHSNQRRICQVIKGQQ